MAKFRSRFWLLVLITFACPRAYESLGAQFDEPYDPDFAAPAPPDTRPAPEGPSAPEPAEGELELPDWLREAGPFLLHDRADPRRILSSPPGPASPRDFREFLLEQRPFDATRAGWNKMREDFEAGTMPVDELLLPDETPSGDTTYIIAGATEPPAAPPDEVQLPTYGTSLSITGRKLVSFNFSQKRFLHEQKTTGRAKNLNLIDIEQQLQLRMQGKVGPKITVNVDYDDTKLNKQDISVVYTGDPNEVVQNASFGDIDLSLPSTEFVSYNKQLFGIRVDIKYKGLRGTFIGSRTKGTTKTKQFRGNTQLVSVDIPDLNYIRQRHYDLSFDNATRLPLLAGSERVFLSRQSAGQANVNELTLTADDLAVQSSSFTGKFVELARGIDYTVDYIEGILTFRNFVNPQDVVAVDFIDASNIPIRAQSSVSTGTTNGSGRFKLVKTFSDVAIVSTQTETGFKRELKTFYSIGRSQIVRDDGRGNFFLKVLDSDRNEVGSGLNPRQVYPETIEVDFENGTFQLAKQFGTSPSSPTPDVNLYAPVPVTKGLLFQAEFRFRLKTFFLEPNLVLQSEIILLDGIALQRNVDYFIDYDSGFMTFFNEQRIRPDSVIDASYEVAPFTGVATESLLGTRVSYDLLANTEYLKTWSIGSTLLYQTGSKPTAVPSITDLAESLLVYEGDTQFLDLRILPGFKGSFQAEIAQSRKNPNLSGRAIVENMEGVKTDDSAGMLDSLWQFGANPLQASFDPRAVKEIITEDVLVRNINKDAAGSEGDSVKTLKLSYDFVVSPSTEVSLVYVFSPTGVDFSQKNILEVTMFQPSASGNEINFHLGGIAEDADGDGVFDTEDLGDDGIPNTADPGELDDILQPDEDKGITYNPPGAAPNFSSRGAGNGRIDTEDLNANGRLDPADFSGCSIGYNTGLAGACPSELFDATSNSTRTFLNFSGWHTFQIPLNISTATQSNFLAIKQVRVSIRRRAGGDPTGSIQFARIAAVGNTWQRGQEGDPFTSQGKSASESLTVNAVNNVDNPNYVPIFSPAAGSEALDVFHTLFGSVDEAERLAQADRISEQALELRYSSLSSGTTVFTRRAFVRAVDISQHYNFSFLLYGNADSGTPDTSAEKRFFLRAGADQAFFEIQVPVNFTGWKRITARQVDKTGDQIPDIWEVGHGPDGTIIVSTGNPSLQQIGQLTAGILSRGNTKNNGAVFLNEIHVSDPVKRSGNARKLQMDFTLSNWATFGMKYRFVDRNYQTPTTVVSNQDNRQDTGYLNFTRIRSFPMNFNLARSIVTTANTNAVGSRSNITTLLAEGTVLSYVGSAKGNFSHGSLPRLNLGYDRSYKDTEFLERIDDTRGYASALNYGVPIRRFFLPNTIDLSFQRRQALVEFKTEAARRQTGNFETDELTDTYGVRLTFTPWSGSSLAPNYTLTTVSEKRNTFFSSGVVERLKYAKSLNQTAGFSSTWNLLSWLKPNASYSVTTIENNVLTLSTFTVAGGTPTVFGVGDLKTINRNSTGNLSLTMNIAQIWKRTKLLRSFSLTNSYQVQDGDVWNSVEKELDTRPALWVRTPLRPQNRFAERQTLTLRDTFNSTQRWTPLEGYELGGRKSAFKTLALTNNYVQSIQRTETTNTPSKTISTTLPDVIASISQLERLTFSERWARNMQMNFKYSSRKVLNVGQSEEVNDAFGTDLRAIIRARFDTSMSFNLRTSERTDIKVAQVTQRTDHKDATVQSTFDYGKVRFTPKVDYQQDISELGTGVQTQNTRIITPSVLIRTDIALPQGLYLPIARKTLKFTNRIIWTTTSSLAWRSSPVTLADNSRLFNLNTNADYELAQNLRMTLNGSVQRLWHDKIKEEDFISYAFGTTLTFQF